MSAARSAARRNIYWPLTIISEARKQMDTLGPAAIPFDTESKRPRSFPSLQNAVAYVLQVRLEAFVLHPLPPSHWPFRFFFFAVASSFSIFLLCVFPLLLSFCFSLSSTALVTAKRIGIFMERFIFRGSFFLFGDGRVGRGDERNYGGI